VGVNSDNIMKRFPYFLITLLIFWLIFFGINRFVFLLYNFNSISDIGFLPFIKSFFYALELDLSTACYLLVFSFLVLLAQSFFQFQFFARINKIYTYCLVVLISLITSAELPLYEEWRTKLTYKALYYLSQPMEIVESSSIFNHIIFLLAFSFQTFVGIFVYARFFHVQNIIKSKVSLSSLLIKSVVMILSAGFILLGIRGGFQEIPINQSDVYYSRHDLINIASVNSAWNLIHGITQNYKYLDSNPYQVYDQPEAERIVKELLNGRVFLDVYYAFKVCVITHIKKALLFFAILKKKS